MHTINTHMSNNIQQHIDFSISTYCQAKCRSCQRTNQDTGEPEDWLIPSHMSYDLFNSMMDKTPDTLRVIQFCGELGDPMMHPDITKFVDRALSKESIKHLVINTNGGLRNPEWYTNMGLKYGSKILLQFGIDGITHDTNWKYREGVDFAKAWDNMIASSKTDIDLEWHFLIFKWNWQEVTEAANLAKKHNIKLQFKFNGRDFGLISPEDKAECKELIRNVE